MTLQHSSDHCRLLRTTPTGRRAGLHFSAMEFAMPYDQSLIPHITINDNAKAAIDFYKKAFGAEEIGRHDADDGKRLMHAHIKVNGHDLFLMDAFPEHGS